MSFHFMNYGQKPDIDLLHSKQLLIHGSIEYVLLHNLNTKTDVHAICLFDLFVLSIYKGRLCTTLVS